MMKHQEPAHPLLAAAIEAIGRGDLAGLESLLKRAPELVHARTAAPVNATLLHCTAFNGIEGLQFNAPPNTPDLAQLLLEFGADPEALTFEDTGGTALCWALSSWFTYAGGVQSALADVYLDGGASIDGVHDDEAPLGHAIAFGYTSSVEHLVARGARADHLYAAAALGQVGRIMGWMNSEGEFAPECLEFPRGPKPETGRYSWPLPHDPDPAALALLTAATHGRFALVRELLRRGVDVNSCVSMNQSALHFAAYGGHAEVVRVLLEHGARRDSRERQFERTPAEWAHETNEAQLAALIERT